MSARDRFRMTGIAAALLAAFGPVHAAEVLAPVGLNTAASSASIGLGYTPDDGRRFGQYTGVNEEGAYGLLDFNLVKRDEATGTWLNVFGRNVGLDNRQLRFEHTRQGNWGYFIEYSQIPRFEPLTVTTGVTGIGTPNLTVPSPATPGVPVNLGTKREAIGLGFDKFLFGNWDLQVRFRNEEKNGERIFGRGSGSTMEFIPDPINYTTRQLDAKANYTGSQLQMAGGYYGTLFNNHNTGLNIAGGDPGLATFTPIALPPDNQSHQLYLSGGYGFTPTTRGNFKVAYAKATQDDTFINVPVLAGIGTSLDGRVDTTLVQMGVTSRPMPKLSLLADFRYEDRDDKTPQRFYGTSGSTTTGVNDVRSIETTTGKAEASYALPNAFRLTGGIGYEEKTRNTAPVHIVSFRETTEELSYRVELRRMMSETVTGAISYIHGDRDGSPWVQTTVTAGTPGSNLIAPIHLADRKRDKIRLLVNWTPVDPLTLTFTVDDARDEYATLPGSTIGPMDGKASNYAIDVSYAFTQRVQGTAWYSRNDTKATQTTCENAATPAGCPASAADPVWGADLQSKSDSVGLGFRGKTNGRFELGGDLSFSDITDSYRQFAISPSTSTVPTPLPDITTKLTRVNVWARYALAKNSGVRLDYVYDRYKTDDWTWSSWVYTDGTQLADPNQTVNFFGVTYYFRFR
ncbi:MAG: MtrB/PioB family decaheme-associated outer membrane protein [Burkholderiales bacterium]